MKRSEMRNLLLTERNELIMRIHLYYVYILTNAHHSVLHTEISNDLVRR